MNQKWKRINGTGPNWAQGLMRWLGLVAEAAGDDSDKKV
jgi:hypothetical protein